MLHEVTDARREAAALRKAAAKIAIAAVMRGDGGVAGEIGNGFAPAALNGIEPREQIEQNVANDIFAILRRRGGPQTPAHGALDDPLGFVEEGFFASGRMQCVRPLCQTVL